MKQIPLVQVTAGTHRAAGKQIGAACREALARAVARSRERPPQGCSWESMRHAAAPYREATIAALPWVADEVDGCASGSGLDPADLWVLAVEEIWRHPPQGPAPSGAVAGKCSDFAAGPPATFDGGVWVAHNNDLSPTAEDDLAAIHWRLPGQPELFTVGVGLFISVALNSAGLCLTGNEVGPNDERVGVPRLLIVRDIVAQRTSAGAIEAALQPERASSYNNLISHADGTIVNVEASATAHALLHAEDGWTVHTNHYVAPGMQPYESDRASIQRSQVRYERARALMQTRSSPVTPEMLRTFLSDHCHEPASLCRHSGESQTVFWCVVDVSHQSARFGRGRPCDGETQSFNFGALETSHDHSRSYV